MTQIPSSKTPLSVERARDILLERTKLLPTEQISLEESYGRVLAKDIASDMDISPFDNSGMDGFAVRFADFEAAGPTADAPLTLGIVGVIAAGEVFAGTLQAGQALRIMTGAPMPAGADTVLKIEDTTVLGQSDERPEGSELVCTTMPKYQQHVRRKAEEAHKGDVLLHHGDRVSAAGAGLLAATGNAELLVYRRPRGAIISTGSELVPVTALPGPGQIRNSNSYSLAAAVSDAGGIPTIMPSVEDTLVALCSALEAAVGDHDFVITSGGAADGDFDFITLAMRELGELFFSKVNMKPGKSQIFGLIADTPVFGLPGNPGAASVGFEVLIRPALRRMQGITLLDRPLVQAALVGDMKKPPETRRCYLRAQLSRATDGRYLVAQDANQSSALLGALHRSNCLLIVPEGQAAPLAGDLVDCLRLDVEEGTL